MALETVQAPGPVKAAPWITEPGCYDLNDDQYHGDPVVGGSLSSTGARLILPPNGSPAMFRQVTMFGRADTRAFDVGRAAHREVLGVGDEIEVVAGSGSDVNTWRTNDDRAAVQAVRDAGKTPVTPRDAKTVRAMADAVRRHPVAGPLFARQGMAEHSFVARDPGTGVMCRVRADWIPDDGDVVDYKTTKSAEPGRFAKAVAEYGYHVQGDFYLSVLRWLGMVGEGARFMLVAQEKVPPYLLSIHVLDAEALRWGGRLNARARELFRECSESDTWPGYPAEPVTLSLPRWLTAEYESTYGAEPGELAFVDPPSRFRPTFAGQVFDTVRTGHEVQRLLEAMRRCVTQQELIELRAANQHLWNEELNAVGGELFARLAAVGVAS
jgi:hypothetical protein